MANVAAATNAVHIGSTEKQVHYLRVMGPFTPESLATMPGRRTTNRTSAYIQPGVLGEPPDRPAQLRDQAVLGRDRGLARRQHPERTRLQRTNRRQHRQSERVLPPPSPVRIRQPGQHDDGAGPGLHRPGPVRADLRQRPPGDDLPAHLRTGRLASGPFHERQGKRPAAGDPSPPTQFRSLWRWRLRRQARRRCRP